MTDEQRNAVLSDANTTESRQRKKRKWDQPAEALLSVGVAVSGPIQYGNLGSLGGISLPGAASASTALLVNPLVISSSAILPVFSVVQTTAAVIPKSNQHKIQDELIIAREIVINDAESSVRYKLTKRQTQEEIQKCTGAVVITRGKYRPPNALANGEKPLYLHISAAAHLKDTAERILAVDRAASMIEDMLKQGQNSQPASVSQTTTSNGVKALDTCVFLGFDADPSLNIASRIRGPNDQYINHIMNETGATVALRGHGSGNFESLIAGEEQQPLHLYLLASNSKSLEDAKLLAENLLDTISLECGAFRVSSSKTYGSVPPPQQLIYGIQSSAKEHKQTIGLSPGLMTSMTSSSILSSSVAAPAVAAVFQQATVSQSVGTMNYGQAQSSLSSYSQPSLNRGTSYSGYGGIYPQATPLQQVALALRHSPSTVISTVAPTTSATSMTAKESTNTASKEKLPPQKRKFQEMPINTESATKLHQGPESVDLDVRNVSTMPAPKKLVQSSSNGMPPPPPRDMPPPPPQGMPPPPQKKPPSPPPPKFVSSTATRLHEKNNALDKAKSATLPDTLIKLMEYGEEDDDDDAEETVGHHKGDSIATAVKKPFWAL